MAACSQEEGHWLCLIHAMPSSDPGASHWDPQTCCTVEFCAPHLAIPTRSGCCSSTPPPHTTLSPQSPSRMEDARLTLLLCSPLPCSHGAPSPGCLAPAGGDGLPVPETNQIPSSRAELCDSSTSRSKHFYHFLFQRALCSSMAAGGTPRSLHGACSPPPRAFYAETSDQKQTSPSGATEGCHDAGRATPSLYFNLQRAVMEGKISRKDPKVSCLVSQH